MNFIKCTNPEEGTRLLADKIISSLSVTSKVLWLIPGGSNIPMAVSVMEMVRKNVNSEQLSGLTMSLTDERYGPVGHRDSNWQQLIEHSFDFTGIKSVPILNGLSLEETTTQYGKNIVSAIDEVNIVIGQFGIGTDGHIAGILPNSPAVHSTDSTFSYISGEFTRITLTPITLLKISSAFAFAFGESKRQAMHDLQTKDLSLEEQPASILKKLPEASLFSDIFV